MCLHICPVGFLLDMDLCFLFVVVNDCLCNKETEFLIVPEEDMVGRLPCPCIGLWCLT